MNLLSAFQEFPPASAADLQEANEKLPCPMPIDLVEIYKRTNGLEGSLSEWLNLVLWPVEDLVFNNQGYNMGSFIAGLVLIGSDTTGQAFGYFGGVETKYIEISFVGFEEKFAKVHSGTFFEFLESINLGRRNDSEA